MFVNVLALDIGDVRIGLAYGNTKNCVSVPLKICRYDEVLNNSIVFRSILQDYQVEKFIIGLPKSLDGQENKQACYIKKVSDKISKLYNLPIEFVDERLSSKEAKSILKQQGLSEKQIRGKVDSVAASLFLDTYLRSLQ